MIANFTRYIPNTITLLNLLSGCLACIFTFRQQETFGCLQGYELVYIFIGAAAVFDFCDGAAARLLHRSSPIGRELDSLSDLVSFGLAPGLLIFNIMESHEAAGSLLPYAALFIPMMGALRLAIFNVDSTQTTTFRGLPIPANAIFWIGFCGWMHRYNIYPASALIVLIIAAVSLLMVSGLRMFSLKFHDFDISTNLRRYVILLATIVFMLFYGIAGLGWTIVLYVMMSALTRRHTDE